MISFSHNDTSIKNPFESECGRFEVQPVYFGFVDATLQDGRRALVKALPAAGEEIRLTTEDGQHLPTTAENAWIERAESGCHGEVIERHPVPLAGTLAAYVQTLTHLTEIELDETLQRLRTDSSCGKDCVKVLDKANEFSAVAYNVREQILAAAARQLLVYYYG